MYQVRNKVYSEAGYILIGNNKKKVISSRGNPPDFTEEKKLVLTTWLFAVNM